MKDMATMFLEDAPATVQDKVAQAIVFEPVGSLLPLPDRDVLSVRPEDTICHCADKMVGAQVGAALVTNEAFAVVGIITERDILRWVAEGRAQRTVSEIMTRQVASLKVQNGVGYLINAFLHAEEGGEGFRHMPVECTDGNFGMVSMRDLLRHFQKVLSGYADLNRQVGELHEEVLRRISTIAVAPTMRFSASVQMAASAMWDWKRGCVLVTDAAGSLAGIFTERDLMRIADWRNLAQTQLREVMVVNPDSVTASARVGEAMSTMVNRGFRHMPIVEHVERRLAGKPFTAFKSEGVLTMRDLVRELSSMNWLRWYLDLLPPNPSDLQPLERWQRRPSDETVPPPRI